MSEIDTITRKISWLPISFPSWRITSFFYFMFLKKDSSIRLLVAANEIIWEVFEFSSDLNVSQQIASTILSVSEKFIDIQERTGVPSVQHGRSRPWIPLFGPPYLFLPSDLSPKNKSRRAAADVTGEVTSEDSEQRDKTHILWIMDRPSRGLIMRGERVKGSFICGNMDKAWPSAAR